jgi:outer membrane usher protein
MRHKRPKNTNLCALLLSFLLVPKAPAWSAEPEGWGAHGIQGGTTTLLLNVEVDGRAVDAPWFVFREENESKVMGKDLTQAGIAVPVAGVEHPDEQIALDAIPGLKYSVDERRSTLVIQCSAQCYPPNTLSLNSGQSAFDAKAGWGGYLNYDLLAEFTSGNPVYSGFFEAVHYNPWGVGVTSSVGRDLGSSMDLLRLESYWVHDRPGSRRRLRAGDSATRSGNWGRSVLFGGLQFGTDFSLQPHFVRFPTPQLSAEASLPSTLDVFVNDALRSRQDIEPGPFTITDLPLVTGGGQVRAVVTDLLGRQHVIEQPYSDYSAEVGLVRRGFATKNFSYGDPLLTGTWLHGLSDTLTMEVHSEATPDLATLGTSLFWTAPRVGEISGSLAGGLNNEGLGHLYIFGYDYLGTRFSVGGRAEFASSGFASLGRFVSRDSDSHPPRHTFQAYAGFYAGAQGSFSLSYLDIDQQQSDLRLLNASYSRNLGNKGFLQISLLHTIDPGSDSSIQLTWTKPVGSQSSVTAALGHDDTGNFSTLAYQSFPEPYGGFGGQASVDLREDSERYSASVLYSGQRAEAQADFSRLNSEQAVRLNARGGLAVAGGGFFITQQLRESFAVADVGDVADIPVRYENRDVGRSGRNGKVLVPNLRAYESNQIGIDADALPLHANVERSSVTVMPRFRSGMTVDFEVKSGRAALVELRGPDGMALPAGTRIAIAGRSKPLIVDSRSRVFIEDAQAGLSLIGMPNGTGCTAQLPPMPSDKSIAELEPMMCRPAP